MKGVKKENDKWKEMMQVSKMSRLIVKWLLKDSIQVRTKPFFASTPQSKQNSFRSANK